MAPAPPDWFVVVPVKGGAAAKSRLGLSPDGLRESVATALARDTVAAAVAGMPPGRVLVVTSASDVAGWAVDPRGRRRRGPRGRARRGSARRSAAAADLGARDVAVLLGDHPALRPAELAAALVVAAAYERAVVPDAAGTGTALLTARGVAPSPRFGAGSAARHVATGASGSSSTCPGCATTSTTSRTCDAVARLGVGPSTRATPDR